jgi:hypothetical protein
MDGCRKNKNSEKCDRSVLNKRLSQNVSRAGNLWNPTSIRLVMEANSVNVKPSPVCAVI